MQFNKNTSSANINLIKIATKVFLGIVLIVGFVFLINKIDFPAPKKNIEKIIPNENFKVVK
tara:strand:+ start:53 stop:235 length:183 start_codon:yes stop_codon:yes gene_type:complete